PYSVFPTNNYTRKFVIEPVYDNLDSEEVSFQINDGKWGVFYPVIDIWRLGWVKIINPENKSQTGWLSPEYRSANQYFPTTLSR
ncbi:MAG: hypothetical protein ACI4TL_03765, partial [Candidatus Cryptobacteroides sp.]